MALAEYLLFTLNRFHSRAYLAPCGLDAPEENVERVLAALARRMGNSEHRAATHLLALYRRGELGRFTLDEVSRESALAIASSTTGQTLLQAGVAHERLMRKRAQREARIAELQARGTIPASREPRLMLPPPPAAPKRRRENK